MEKVVKMTTKRATINRSQDGSMLALPQSQEIPVRQITSRTRIT